MSLPQDIDPINRAKGMYTFWGAYCVYEEECAMVWSREWNENTRREYKKIIREKIIWALPNHDTTPINEYTKQDYLSAIQRIQERGQRESSKEYKSYQQNTLDKYLHIIKTIVKVTAEHEMFEDVFFEPCSDESTSVNTSSSTKLSEIKPFSTIAKSFTAAQSALVLDFLLSKIKTSRTRHRGEYIALFLMHTLGLRNAEAAGASFGQLKEMHDYPGNYYLTISQSTIIGSNELQIGGKTYNVGRNIPIPKLALQILFDLRKERIAALADDPCRNVKEIDTIPIAYSTKGPFDRCTAAAITSAGKKMFTTLKMQPLWIKANQQLRQDQSAVNEEDYSIQQEFALVEKDATSYLLRRNFATDLAILQLSESESAYLMGHVIQDPQTKRRDFSDERILISIKGKLDKRAFLNNIPSRTTVNATTGTILLGGYNSEIVLPNNASHIYISAIANEPNDSIDAKIVNANEVVSSATSIRAHPFPQEFPQEVNILEAYHKACAKYAMLPKHETNTPIHTEEK